MGQTRTLVEGRRMSKDKYYSESQSWKSPYVKTYINFMNKYTNGEKLKLTKLVGVTKEVYNILRDQKRKQKISMAKIICNAIIEKYSH